MPATKARSTNMIRRQSFTGKTLTFIEVLFNQNYAGSATTPESDGSTFQTVTNVINSSAGNGGTLLAISYHLGRKATDEDARINTAITAGNSIDVYQYIVEGEALFDAPASAGAEEVATGSIPNSFFNHFISFSFIDNHRILNF